MDSIDGGSNILLPSRGQLKRTATKLLSTLPINMLRRNETKKINLIADRKFMLSQHNNKPEFKTVFHHHKLVNKSRPQFTVTTIRKMSDNIKKGFNILNEKITPGTIASFGKAKIDIITSGESGIIANAPTIAAGLKKTIIKLFGDSYENSYVYDLPDLFMKLVNIFKYINSLIIVYNSIIYLKDNNISVIENIKLKINNSNLGNLIKEKRDEFKDTNEELYDKLKRLEEDQKKMNAKYDEERKLVLKQISDKSKPLSAEKSTLKSSNNDNTEELVTQVSLISEWINTVIEILDADDDHLNRLLKKTPKSATKIKSRSPIEEIDGGKRRTGKNKSRKTNKTRKSNK